MVFTILFIAIVAALVCLTVLFGFLDKRQQLLGEKVYKIDQQQQVLNDNYIALQTDFKKLYNELQSTKKDINKKEVKYIVPRSP